MGRLIDLTGKTFERLTVLARVGVTKSRDSKWECRCECGTVTVVTGGNLKSGTTKSCGCFTKDRMTTHGLIHDPLYNVWLGIKARTTNPNNSHFKYYGDRGISMLLRWQANPESFIKYILSALGPKPTPQHSIDRIDNDKGYIPGNLRWADAKTQASNRGYCHDYLGTKTHRAWAHMKERGDLTTAFKDFKTFLASMGEKPDNARIARHDRTKPHGLDNTYWKLKRV